MILEPPEAPHTILTSPLESVTMAGDMEERGRLPGFMKFARVGGYLNALE